jgi:hypothetical protein
MSAIEQGVPVPPKMLRKYPFIYEIQAGESVLIPLTTNLSSLRSIMSGLQRRDGKKFTLRTLADGYRIWRLK